MFANFFNHIYPAQARRRADIPCASDRGLKWVVWLWTGCEEREFWVKIYRGVVVVWCGVRVGVPTRVLGSYGLKETGDLQRWSGFWVFGSEGERGRIPVPLRSV